MKTQALKSNFLFSILSFAFCIHSNAQIVYTDVNPAQTFTANNSVYHLDINNDGTADYDITILTGIGFGAHPYAYIKLTPLSGNSVSVTASYPSALTDSTLISSANTWWVATNYSMARDGWNINWHTGQGVHVRVGNWLNATDKYLGLKFIVGGITYYGWARLDAHVYSNGTADFTIKDYAYNSVANQSILAGDIGNVLTNIIHNENLTSQFSIYPNPVFNSATISFSLEQSQNVSLKVFDMNGRLIKTLADNIFDEGENQIELNAEKLNAGIYFLKMQAGEFLKTEKLVVTK